MSVVTTRGLARVMMELYLYGTVSLYWGRETGKKLLDMGVDAVAPFDIPAQDRNRTSPFRKHTPALSRFSPLFGFFQTVN